MADATVQLDLPLATPLSEIDETQGGTTRALSRRRGGTGVEVTTKAELAAEYLMTGATSGSPGTAGMVPIPPAGSEAKAFVGAGTFSQFLYIENITADDGLTPLVRFLGPNTPDDSDSFLVMRAAQAGSQHFRIIPFSDPGAGGDDLIGFRVEPQGVGARTSEFSDPFPTTQRPNLELVVEPGSATWARRGLGALTTEESWNSSTHAPASPAPFNDSGGHYAQYSTDAADNSTCGVGGCVLGYRDEYPSIYWRGRTALINSAWFPWAGAADPVASTGESMGTSNPGVGFLYDTDVLYSVSNVTYVGSTVTVTTSAPHSFVAGSNVPISGVVSSGTLAALVNVVQTATSCPTSTTIVFTVLGTPTGTYTSGGTVVGYTNGTLRGVVSSGAVLSLSVANVTVDGSKRIHRTAGDWEVDGVKEGQLLTLSGMNTPGNNIAIRVASVSALNITPIAADQALLTTDAVATTAGVAGGGQELINTLMSVTANSRAWLRVRYLGDYVWDFSIYNFTNKTWETPVKSSGTYTPADTDVLKWWWRLRTNSTTARTTSPAQACVRGAN